MSYSAANRPIEVLIDGQDHFVVLRVEIVEELSKPWVITADLIADANQSVTPSSLLGKEASLTLQLTGNTDERRTLHGKVRRFARTGATRAGAARSYQVEIVPPHWFLSLSRDHRIFQKKSAKDIVEAILQEASITDVRFSINETPAVREYCVQYGESTLDFMHRLMEEEGIFYYFVHGDDKSELVFADSGVGLPVLTDGKKCMLDDDDFGEERRIASMLEASAAYPSEYALNDYNFETPTASLLESLTGAGLGTAKVYEYPGGYGARAAGARVSKLRMESAELPAKVLQGTGTVVSMAAGHVFEVDDPLNMFSAGALYVLAVRTTAEQPTPFSGTERYEATNTFSALPTNVTYRPPMVTRHPRIPGTQTAVVVGPNGEEIYADKYGRVKVQFHWDRLGRRNETSSCWVRVATSWAGVQWGAIQLPRIGQEVVVSFLDGDPDYPLIVGAVYNADNMPPYELPANITQSGVKSNSSKGGGGFNEIRFEDKKDAEEIHVHAQKDYTRVVEHDDTDTIKGQRSVTLTAENGNDDKKGNDTLLLEKGDQSITLTKGNQTVTLTEGDYTFEATKGNGTVTYKEGNLAEELTKGDHTFKVLDGTQTIEVKQDQTLTVTQGNRKVVVEKGDDEHEVATGHRKVVVKTGNDTTEVSAGNHELKVNTGNSTQTISVGNVTIKASAGKVTIEALQGIELKCGPMTSVKLTPEGIEMKQGPITVVKLGPDGASIGGAMVKLDGKAMTEVKGLMTKVDGTTMTQVKGLVTMIN